MGAGCPGEPQVQGVSPRPILTWSTYTAVMAPEWPCSVKRQHESSRRNTWGWASGAGLGFGRETPPTGQRSLCLTPAPRPVLRHAGSPDAAVSPDVARTHPQSVVLAPGHETPGSCLQSRDGFLVRTGHRVGQAAGHPVTAAVHRGRRRAALPCRAPAARSARQAAPPTTRGSACPARHRPRNCRGLKAACVSKEKKSRDPLSRAATILKGKRRWQVARREAQVLGREAEAQQATHDPCLSSPSMKRACRGRVCIKETSTQRPARPGAAQKLL